MLKSLSHTLAWSDLLASQALEEGLSLSLSNVCYGNNE